MITIDCPLPLTVSEYDDSSLLIIRMVQLAAKEVLTGGSGSLTRPIDDGAKINDLTGEGSLVWAMQE
jgi:hypothetical protein